MESENIFNSKNIKTIVVIGIIVMILTLAISLIQTPKYKSSAKLLVVITQDSIDPYTASRTSDYIANIISEVVYSNSFIDNIFKSNFEVKDDLGSSLEKRMKTWKKMVQVQTKENKGIVFIDVLHQNKEQANQFAQAISYTIITKHTLYHGLGDKVAIKMIDAPALASKKSEPKIMINTLLGLLAGLVIGFTLIIIFPEQELYRIFTFNRNKNRQDEMINLNREVEQLEPETPQTNIDLVEKMEDNIDNNNIEAKNQNNYYDW